MHAIEYHNIGIRKAAILSRSFIYANYVNKEHVAYILTRQGLIATKGKEYM